MSIRIKRVSLRHVAVFLSPSTTICIILVMPPGFPLAVAIGLPMLLAPILQRPELVDSSTLTRSFFTPFFDGPSRTLVLPQSFSICLAVDKARALNESDVCVAQQLLLYYASLPPPLPPSVMQLPPLSVYRITPGNIYLYTQLWGCPSGAELLFDKEENNQSGKLYMYVAGGGIILCLVAAFFVLPRPSIPRLRRLGLPATEAVFMIAVEPAHPTRSLDLTLSPSLAQPCSSHCLGERETLARRRRIPFSPLNPNLQELPPSQLLKVTDVALPDSDLASPASVLGAVLGASDDCVVLADSQDSTAPAPPASTADTIVEECPHSGEYVGAPEVPQDPTPQSPPAACPHPATAQPPMARVESTFASLTRLHSRRGVPSPRRVPSTPAPDDSERRPFRFESGPPRSTPTPTTAPPLPTLPPGSWKMRFTPLRPASSAPTVSSLVRESADVPAPPTPGPAETIPKHVASPAAVERMSATATPAPPSSTPVETTVPLSLTSTLGPALAPIPSESPESLSATATPVPTPSARIELTPTTAIPLSPTSTPGSALAPVPSDSRDFFVSLPIRYEHWGGRRASPYRIPSPSQRTARRGSPAPTPTPAARTKSRPVAIALAPPSSDPFVVVSVATTNPGGFELHSPPKSRSSKAHVAPTPTRPPRVLSTGVEGSSPTHAEPSSTPRGSPPQAIRVCPAPSRLVVPPAARLAPPRLPAPAPIAPTCHGHRHYPYPTPPRPQQLPPAPSHARAAQSPVVPASVTRKLVGRARAWRETPVDAEEEIAAELIRHGAPGRANPNEYSVVAGWQATTVTLMRSTRLRGGEVGAADAAAAMPQATTIQGGSGAGTAGLDRAGRPVSRLPVRKGTGKARVMK